MNQAIKAFLSIVLLLQVNAALCQDGPVILSTNPPSRKFNPTVGSAVDLSVTVSANPDLQQPTDWTFINTSGIEMGLPENSTTDTYSLTFTFSSISYYGNYSCSLHNANGTTVVTFQVLPEGIPDTPNLSLNYATHYSISVIWTCMWSNSATGWQTISLQLMDATGRNTIGTASNSIQNCYNSTYTTLFSTNIQPETNYVVTANSSNEIGSSIITTLDLKTIKPFQFIVTPESIQINWPLAVINFLVESGNISYFLIDCCIELTGVCTDQYGYNDGTTNSVTMFIGILPNYTEYVFDFTLYVGMTNDVLGSVDGIRGGYNSDPGNECEINEGLLVGVIVLAILLGVALILLMALGIGFCKRSKGNHPQNPPCQTNVEPPSVAEKGECDYEYAYQAMDGRKNEMASYIELVAN